MWCRVSYHLPAFWWPFSMLSLSECSFFPSVLFLLAKRIENHPPVAFKLVVVPWGVCLVCPLLYPEINPFVFCQLLWLVRLSVSHGASCHLFCWLPTYHMSSQSDAVLKLAMVGYVWVCCNERWGSQHQTQAGHCPLATSTLSLQLCCQWLHTYFQCFLHLVAVVYYSK